MSKLEVRDGLATPFGAYSTLQQPLCPKLRAALATDTWLDFVKEAGYITSEQHTTLALNCHKIGKMLGAMIKNPKKFLRTSDLWQTLRSPVSAVKFPNAH